jgi:hypothetical protein
MELPINYCLLLLPRSKVRIRFSAFFSNILSSHSCVTVTAYNKEWLCTLCSDVLLKPVEDEKFEAKMVCFVTKPFSICRSALSDITLKCGKQ